MIGFLAGHREMEELFISLLFVIMHGPTLSVMQGVFFGEPGSCSFQENIFFSRNKGNFLHSMIGRLMNRFFSLQILCNIKYVPKPPSFDLNIVHED